MAHEVIYSIKLFGLICLASSGLECAIQSEGSSTTSTGCANGQHSITCGSNTVIAITGVAYGYKGASPNCSTATGSCCTYNSTTDCLESSTTDTTPMDALSGKSDGIVNIADAIAITACTSGFMSVSTFNRISYQCIPESRIFDICLPSSYRSGDGLPVYIWNRDYNSGTSILATDTSCSVSVEVLSRSTNTELYTLHMQLSDSSTSCLQSITVSNGSNIVKTFGCNHAPFNQIQSETISGNYFILNLTNTAQSSGGKFWIGLQGESESLPMLLSSPAVERIDCGALSNPINGNVYTTDTFYGSTVSYACDPGFVITSGNIFRTCQEDKTWSGHAVVCLYDCGNLARPANGFVSFTGTSPGHTATYGCEADYVMRDGSLHRTCIDGIGWNGSGLRCIFDCGPLSNPPNGRVSYEATTAGSQATYACRGDLVLNGPENRNCISDSGWEGSEPACSSKDSDCGTLYHPANGMVFFSGTFPGQTANYSCNSNFVMSGGSAHRTCIDGAGWNGTAILCVYDCGGLSNLTNGTVNYSATTEGSRATYTCNNGSVLNGSPTRICHNVTGWSGSEPACLSHISECFDIKTVILVVSFVEALIVVIGVVFYKCRLIVKIRNCIVTVTASENIHSPGKDILFSTARTNQFELTLTNGSPFNNLVQKSETSEQVNSEKQTHITEETPGTSLYTPLNMCSNPSESIYSELHANIGGSGLVSKIKRK